MKRVLGVAMAVLVAAAPLAAGEREDAQRPGRKDAPRLLKEAVTAGTVDDAAFAAIADWILHEKEEKVAAGLVDLLGAVEPQVAAASGERWNATTNAVFSLFGSVLRDAQGNRRRGEQELDAEIAALVKVAAPAVAGAFREIDPAERARIAALFLALGPLTDDLAPLLGTDITAAARGVLEESKDR
jgi:hypothetical protein